MKKQIVGSAFVISLIVLIVCLDRLVVLGFPSLSGSILVVSAIALIIVIASLVVIKMEERTNDKAKHSLKDKIILIVSNTCSGSILDTLIVLTFIAFAAWIPDSVSDFIKEGTWEYLSRPFIYIVGLIVMIWGKPGIYVMDKNIPDENRHLLLTGISNISIIGDKGKLNVVPLIKPFEKYKDIETVVVLLSDGVLCDISCLNDTRLKSVGEPLQNILRNYRDTIVDLGIGDRKLEKKNKEVEDALEAFLKGCIKACYPEYYGNKELVFVFSSPVDCNKFKDCNEECFDILNYAMQGGGKRRRYDDDEVIVNTTPSTSVVSSVMTINAIKGNRGMLCMNQQTFALEVADPDVTLIQFEGWEKDKETRRGK